MDRPSADPYYVGLRKALPTPTSTTYWLDGSSSMYRPYKSGEPDQWKACFIMNSNGELEDYSCLLSTARYICKMEEETANGKIIIVE